MKRTALGATLRDDRGAIAVIVALFVIVMVAMSALVVDVGYYYNVKRQLQSAADAAALAGCQELIQTDDLGKARASALEYAALNAVRPADGMGAPNVEVTDQYVRVTCIKTAPGFFARALNKNSTDIIAVAKAVRVRVTGARMLVPWALPIVDEVDHVEAAIVNDAGGVVSQTILDPEDELNYSGFMTAPSTPGGYYVRVRVYNKHNIWEGLRVDAHENKETYISRLGVVDGNSAIQDCSLSDNLLDSADPAPPTLTVVLKDPYPGGKPLAVSVGKSNYNMTQGSDRSHWSAVLGGLPVSNDLCVELPVDIKNLGLDPDALLILKRNSHVLYDAEVSQQYVTGGTSIEVRVALNEYLAHQHDGINYVLRVEGGAGAVGNYCELNFKTLVHHDCPEDPAGTVYGSNYYDWLRYGYGGGIHIGDFCDTSPGNTGANTGKALDERFAGVPVSQRVVDVPVVEKIEDKAGTYTVEIVDFAAFRVNSYDKSGEVRGTFLEYIALPAAIEPGGDPTPEHYLEAPRLVNP
jgi:Flp pilus assembly protein TadG